MANISVEIRKTAFKCRLKTIALVNNNYIDIREFLKDAGVLFQNEVNQMLRSNYMLKVNTCFDAQYKKTVVDIVEYRNLYIQTKSFKIGVDSDIIELFNEHVSSEILNKIEEFEINGSGWTLDKIKEIVVNINKFEAFIGSSYIDLPKYIKNKNAVINVKNFDNECFKWSILSALYPVENNAQRVSKYLQFEKELNFSGIIFPVTVSQISKFEENNKTISVNVYIINKERNHKKNVLENKIVPLRLTKKIKENHIHLLLLHELPKKDEEQKEMENLSVVDIIKNFNVKSHYCWIKNLSRLVSLQSTKHKHKIWFCDRCLQYFKTNEKLNIHIQDCASCDNAIKIKMPSMENKWISFKNYKYQLEAPFIIYADIESLLKPVNQNNNECHSQTVIYQEHQPYSIGYYLKCRFDETKSFYRSYRNPDCIKWFGMELNEISKAAALILNSQVPILLSEDIDDHFKKATHCYICEKEFFEDEYVTNCKVRDHCHLTGKYRGACHSKCNLHYQVTRTISVVFHNLCG